MTKTILCVEDSPTQRAAMVRALRENYEVVEAQDGEQALKLAVEKMPDLILLDVVLPKKNGFQVCRQLKRTGPTRNIKIVLVTARSLASDRYWGLRQGADDYWVKPLDANSLIERVARQLEANEERQS